jgi:hypothetical protein
LAGWKQAETYCNWLGHRLPTFEEWLWAARGRDEQRLFPWGEAPPDFERLFAADDQHQPGRIADASVVDAVHVKLVDVEGEPRRLWIHKPTERGARPLGASRDGVRDLLGNVQEAVFAADGSPAYVGGGYLYRLPDHPDVADLGRTPAKVAKQLMSPKDAGRPHGYAFDRGHGFRCASDDAPEGPAWAPDVIEGGQLVFQLLPGTRRLEEATLLCEKSERADKGWSLPKREQLDTLGQGAPSTGPYWTRSGEQWRRPGTSPSPSADTSLVLCVAERGRESAGKGGIGPW